VNVLLRQGTGTSNVVYLGTDALGRWRGKLSVLGVVPGAAEITAACHDGALIGGDELVYAPVPIWIDAGNVHWPQFHHDPAHSGVAKEFNLWSRVACPEPICFGSRDVRGLTQIWRRDLPGLAPASPSATWTLDGEDTINVHSNGGDGWLRVLAGDDGGRQRWTLEAANNLFGAPAITEPFFGAFDDMIYVADTAGVVWAFADAGSGRRLRWSVFLGPNHNIYSGVTVDDGKVFVADLSGALTALDAGSGTRLWSIDAGLGAMKTTPAVTNGIVYVGGDEGVAAFRSADGSLVWRFPPAFPPLVRGIVRPLMLQPRVTSSIVVANNRAHVFTNAGVLFALRADTGAIDWVRDLGLATCQFAFFCSTPAVTAHTVYIGSGGNGSINALNADNGNVRWQRAVPGYMMNSSPAYANGVLYATGQASGGSSGVFVALDAATGSIQFQDALELGSESGPTVVDGRVYVQDGLTSLSKVTSTRTGWRSQSSRT
jgi:outer membrane protein assembly factor BamB